MLFLINGTHIFFFKLSFSQSFKIFSLKVMPAVSSGEKTKLVQLELLAGPGPRRELNIFAYCAPFNQPFNLDV